MSQLTDEDTWSHLDHSVLSGEAQTLPQPCSPDPICLQTLQAKSPVSLAIAPVLRLLRGPCIEEVLPS